MCDVADGGRFCPFPLSYPLLLRTTLFLWPRSLARSTLHLVGNPCLSGRSAGYSAHVDPSLDLDVATRTKTQRQHRRKRDSLLEPSIPNFLATNDLYFSWFHAIRVSHIFGNAVHPSIATLVECGPYPCGLGIDAERKRAFAFAGSFFNLAGRVAAFRWNKVDFVPTGSYQFNSHSMASNIGAYFTRDNLRGAKITSS